MLASEPSQHLESNLAPRREAKSIQAPLITL
jgi:hypothetical protein